MKNSLRIGDLCPEFSLEDQYGKRFDIRELLGKKIIVVFFYPKDNTSGCTKEACSFRDQYEIFKELGAEVIGVSSDSVISHKGFAEKHHLPYILLSDPQNDLRKQFGVPKSLFGLIPGRVSYVIGTDGRIKGIFNAMTDPVGHVNYAVKCIQELSA
ncbi:MAG: hypothetical protein RIT43_562 [Bacteroidota bacterium]